ncbi:MAG: hypothetical protein M1831_002813 [Alyxoria varia]|nr:MAG: hypothetical protein M1831_002813 [Alyxoria varia]
MMQPSLSGQTNGDNDQKAQAALEFAHQAEKLAHEKSDVRNENANPSEAVEAKFITALDPVLETASGERLPAVPVDEALKLNALQDKMKGKEPAQPLPVEATVREAKDGTVHGLVSTSRPSSTKPSSKSDAPLPDSIPQSMTNPLFPPLPVYGPPSALQDLQCYFFRVSASILSFMFLLAIILGSAVTSVPLVIRHIGMRLRLRDPDSRRPFYKEEQKRKKHRRETEKAWKEGSRGESTLRLEPNERDAAAERCPEPLEGGPDPLVCDAAYYARRVGLNMEQFDVQTEDGFTIELLHLYDPHEDTPTPPEMRRQQSPDVFRESPTMNGEASNATAESPRKKYPVLLIHGLLQSAGAFCCTDDNSLAFFLAKSGYDVWLGNNRCGFTPNHNLLTYKDPRMWSWNIRQMGVMDLPALISRVLSQTGFEKLGLICHSQGTTQTFVALAKEQRPDIGEKISVFCALAPAVYAGPLISRTYLKVMRLITPNMFRVVFGLHAFIPFMMHMHSVLPARFYGAMGYRVFSFLFGWTDDRWELDLRNRAFQFAPTYVSSESMRWWLGRECFAKQKCILATKTEGKIEDEEDSEEEQQTDNSAIANGSPEHVSCEQSRHFHEDRARFAWYDSRAPPFALWICENDDLVDGKRLLRRFDHGREPFVNVVHRKIIPEYEHLDCIWAMDSIEQVGKEVREVIWKTASESAKDVCRVPVGCD